MTLEEEVVALRTDVVPCLRHRNGHTTVADRKLDQRPLRLARKLDVEGDVGRHVSRPLFVAARKPLVPAHRPILRHCLND
jgi:hypothetical protein